MDLESPLPQLANLPEHEYVIDGGVLAQKVSQPEGCSLG
jgi:hypothetical protein